MVHMPLLLSRSAMLLSYFVISLLLLFSRLSVLLDVESIFLMPFSFSIPPFSSFTYSPLSILSPFFFLSCLQYRHHLYTFCSFHKHFHLPSIYCFQSLIIHSFYMQYIHYLFFPLLLLEYSSESSSSNHPFITKKNEASL